MKPTLFLRSFATSPAIRSMEVKDQELSVFIKDWRW